MLIAIEGGLGTGKTVMLLRYLINDGKLGHKIFANFGIIGLPYNNIDIGELLQKESSNLEFKDATIGIDEITVFVDCRTSTAKRNRIFGYFVLQSRKRNVNVYYTSQDLGMLDFRLTNHTHIVVLCDFEYRNYKKGDRILRLKVKNRRRYTIIDFRDPHNVKRKSFTLDISAYYPYYDTDEIIRPLL